MAKWITKKNGRVGRVCETQNSISPGSGFERVPDGWEGSPGDDLKWFDADMNRIPDAELVASKVREDNRGKWYSTKNIGESKHIRSLDEKPGKDWTQEAPLENEAYQKWDPDQKKFIVDTEKKKEAEKQQEISAVRGQIEDAERRINRSQREILAGTATETDRQYFETISSEIKTLREKIQSLTAS
jgi:hypothetical protein